MNTIQNFIISEDGTDLAEYALILGIVTIAIASAVTAFGGAITGAITNATNALQ